MSAIVIKLNYQPATDETQPESEMELTMPQNLTITALVGCPFTLRVLMTSWCLGMNPTVKWVHSKWQLKTQDYLRREPAGTSGLLETEFGMLTDSEASMRYLARLDTKQNLAGRTNFERAQVVGWSTTPDQVYF